MTNNDYIQRATPHTPEPWTYTHTAIVQDSRGNILADCEIVPSSEGSTPTPEQEVANAHRIVAAVNACTGLRTEALERGMIAELRHVLGELLTAAGDLDAAIDGTTNQFDAERAKLTPAIRAAQTICDGGTELDLHDLLASRHTIAAVWCIEDVQIVRPDLTDEQAWKVLQEAQHKHDAMMGISWDTLEIVADELFGPAPETTTEED